ncbi:MAG: RagB/SusD family nutrient uptake outer membrane protein [Saprospirales bacterium]|nr:RagB/SusD family nutrient uptake outer membrane protein [Saprospirales bacterium]
MNKSISIIFTVLALAALSCTNLDIKPASSVNNEVVFDDPGSYKAFIARVYSGLAVSGQRGPDGDSDIMGINEGFGNYMRGYWQLQTLSTDEAVIAWNDGTLYELHNQDWSPTNEFITATYNRIYVQIAMANEFLRETSDEKLSDRGVEGALYDDIQDYRAEARFLRALSYWHGMDLFGNIPFVTEEDQIGIEPPRQASRAEVYSYIESELKAIENLLPAPKTGEYGRADQAAVWSLLAKLYLNAEVYVGQAKYAECRTYCEKVINSAAYSLSPVYRYVFMADNDTSPEIIFPVTYDGEHTKTWGGTTYLVNAAIGGAMDRTVYGVAEAWAGLRTTSALVNRFPDETGDIDSRALFFTNGQTKEIDAVGTFTQGYALPKYSNIRSDSMPASHTVHPDTDYPMFRLADVYLMYAECVLRNGGGDKALATGYINQIRERAYGNTDGNITADDLTLEFVLDERSRELYWEAGRRIDLIRFGQFSDAGIWPWKGGVKEGVVTEAFRDLFPIPGSDLLANPNLDQNDGY